MVVLMSCYHCGGKGRRNQRRGRNVVERMVVKPTVAVVVAEGTIEKEKRERVLVAEKKRRKTKGCGWFFVNFGLDFLLPQATKSTSILGGGRGKSFLHRGEITALDSVGKDPNRWFKLGMVHCQICSCRLPKLASLGWCYIRFFVSEPVKTIPRQRGMSGD
jgi:hypothetical protein